MERIIAVVGIDAEDITYRLSDNSLLAVPHGGHVYHVGDDVGFPGSGLGRVRSGAAGSPISPSPAAPAFHTTAEVEQSAPASDWRNRCARN